jgi:hypothetical protein
MHDHNPLLAEEAEDAAERERLLALAPDPEVERKRMQLVEAANAAAPVRPSREQSRRARIDADFGLTPLGDGSSAKPLPNGKVGHVMRGPDS